MRLKSGHVSSFLAIGLMFASCTSMASAAPDDKKEIGLEITLKNGTDKNGKPKGSYFSAKGKCQPLINGTRFVVTLAAIGRSRDFPVSVLRAVVTNNRYEVSVPWSDKLLAPLVYQVTVELQVAKQAKAVQQWIMNEYGYAAAHREIIDRRRVLLSTEGERAAFAIENIATIKGFVGRLESVRQSVLKVSTTPVAEIEGWDAKYEKLIAELVNYGSEVDRYFQRYVILLEQGLRIRIEGLLRSLSRILRDHARGRPRIDKRLTRLRKDMEKTVELIKQYEPLPTEETLVPDEGDGDEPKKPNKKEE